MRPEVDRYLITPPEVAAQYSPRVRVLLDHMAHDSGDCPAWVDRLIQHGAMPRARAQAELNDHIVYDEPFDTKN